MNRDLGLLAAYVTTPSLGKSLGEEVVLTRPPTRFLVAVDPEKPYGTDNDRAKQQHKWVKRILEEVPLEHRTEPFEEDLDTLVEIETWGDESFEFAHFSDSEIADAILKVFHGNDAPSLAKLTARVTGVRCASGNIEKLWETWTKPHPTKLTIAEELWPVLERRVRDALSQDTVDEIPIARVALRAMELAANLPRESVAIRTKVVEPNSDL